MTNKVYGIRWSEFDRQDRLVMKEKFFPTEEKRDQFCSKLEEKSNFNSFEAWFDPDVAR